MSTTGRCREGAMAAPLRILGVDPGSHATGWGVVQVHPALHCLASGVIRPARGQELPARLRIIHEVLLSTIDKFSPQIMAVEDLYKARNAHSALVLGHARGAVLLAGACRDLDIHAYAPGTIKRALTGNGQADKEQVRFMVCRLLGLAVSLTLDESDALAAALAHEGRQRIAPAQGARGFG
jgi:crossover junction endodeoxyribonuclease RuvC